MKRILILLLFIIQVNILLAQVPDKCAVPTGINSLCQRGGTSAYQTTGATNAQSYLWKLFPDFAGTISGTGLDAVVTWSTKFNGTARICVAGVNTHGEGETSDTLLVSVFAMPATPSEIFGNDRICNGLQNDDYFISPTEYTDSYKWSLSPTYAGTITENKNKIQIDWNPEFKGLAQISVLGLNFCGEGNPSPIKNIEVVTTPATPALPIGPTSICQGKDTTVLLTTSIRYAYTYIWTINPLTAGSIEVQDTAGIIHWNPEFADTAYIQVQSENECGISEATTWRSLKVKTIPPSPIVTPNSQQLCQNESSSVYEATLVKDASSYTWSISPTEAGTIGGESNRGTVVWNTNFAGVAEIKTYASNNCGAGEISNTAVITRLSLPEMPTTPSGTEHICAGASDVIFTTNKTNYATYYNWSITPANAGSISYTDTTAKLTVGREYVGLVRIKVQGGNNCGTGTYSGENEIRSYENPTAIFTYTDNGFVYNFQNTSIPGLPHEKYTWNFGTGAVSNESSPTYTFSNNGTFRVKFRIDADYCESDSTYKDIVITYYSVDKNPIEGLSWHYNARSLFIHMPHSINQPLQLDVISVNGNKVYSEKLDYMNTSTIVNLPEMPNGIYLLRMSNRNMSNSFKFVVEN